MPVLQAAIGPAPGVILTTRDAVISTVGPVAHAREMAEGLRPLLRLVRGVYADMEIDPGPLLITFAPMNPSIAAYVVGGYDITINSDWWWRASTDPSFPAERTRQRPGP